MIVMSYRVFFSFSVGLKEPMTVPKGTLIACQDHVARVETALGLKAEKYKDNPAHWRIGAPITREAMWEASHMLAAWGGPSSLAGTAWTSVVEVLRKAADSAITDEAYCNVTEAHNRWVRWLYHMLGKWSEAAQAGEPLCDGWHPNLFTGRHEDRWRLMVGNYGKPVETETLTPEDAQTFWHGLQEIDVPAERWSRAHYVSRMEHAYAILRGEEDEGAEFDAKPLTPKRAAAVVGVFSEFLDKHDMRLNVPNGHDYLASSYDGGYRWCEKCGPAHPDDIPGCRKKACPARADRDADDPGLGRRWVLKDKAAGAYLGKTPGEWPTRLGKQVLHLEDRDAAERVRGRYTGRELTVVPVLPRSYDEWRTEADSEPADVSSSGDPKGEP